MAQQQRPEVLESITESQLEELNLRFDDSDHGEFDRIAATYGWDKATADAVWEWFSAAPERGQRT